MTRIEAMIYGVAILTGAVLVFQVQPIAGRFLLPAFGGGASVWTTCMFFFQTMLLAGYGYTHWLTTSLGPRYQAALHGALLLLSIAFLPLGFASHSPNAAAIGPNALIWLVLLVSIGFPFLMLASTAPLMQRWSSITRPARSPYWLYALSNAGALLALLTYPVLLEPALSLQGQTLVWSAGYAVFLLVSLAACRIVWRRPDRPAAGGQGESRAAGNGAEDCRWTPADAALTLLLAACGVVMLLAVTNQITQNIAPVPFLWVMPLIIYLLTFIICFSGPRWYDRTVWGSLFLVAASSLIILEFFASSFAIVPVLIAYLLALFCICLVCHGELYRLRPPPQRLSAYYLLIALGGAIGGALVAVAAPAVFTRYWEALACVYVIYLALGAAVLRDRPESLTQRSDWNPPAFEARMERWARRLFAAGWVGGIFLFPAVILSLDSLASGDNVVSLRNFYGLLNVQDLTNDKPPRRVLVDGTTIHGFQLLDESRRSVPTSYYAADTGIGRVLRGLQMAKGDMRVGVVGLGAGTLAAYGEAGDDYRFYELNPAVADLATCCFSFLEASDAAVEIVVGDGRISLQRELRRSGSRGFDLLVIDAFNSDAIPVHLLTAEAHRLYWEHLEPDGVLAFHVTNNYLDLAPVIADLAGVFGKSAVLMSNTAAGRVSSRADWVVLNHEAKTGTGHDNGITVTRLERRPSARLWTDDYSNLLETIRP